MKLFQRQDRFHPCCGFNLQSVVPKLMPALQFACMKLGLVFMIYGMFQNWESLQRDKIENPTSYYFRLVCWSGYFLYLFVTEGLILLLWKGANSKNPGLIRVWLVTSPIAVVWVAGILIVNLTRFTMTGPNFFVLSVGYCFMQCYLWYVVYFFMKEMEDDNYMASAMRAMTEAEVTEFNLGLNGPQFRVEDLDASTLSLMDRIQYQRYKKEDFEIEEDKLQVEKSNTLGSGDYGTVYKGVLSRNGETITVAVKTVDPNTTDVLCFKALLMELKVMSYLGTHPNVLELLGASTTGIRDRNLLIVSEYCSLGNLHLFLVGHRGLFTNLLNKDGSIEPYSGTMERNETSLTEQISTLDLIRWSHEIACGMTYLGSMRVVHADLSARNVLLNEHKVVKLADFGLARQLYSYAVYVKTQKTPLPWRWLSLEALTDMNFSVSSDIWSYGITLYEIFTLGEIPYQGHNFSLEFICELKAGLRPHRPHFVPQEIWTIMERCWKADPQDRGSFCEISQNLEIFYKLQKNYDHFINYDQEQETRL